MRIPKGTLGATVGLIFIGPSVLMLFGPKAYWIGAIALMVVYSIAFWFEEGS